ncbi:MAG: pilus assembly protein PilM [Patescibacteria group bacterium]
MPFSQKNIAFGLDIGDKSIKLAEVKLIKNLRSQEHLVLTCFNETPVPEGFIINGEIKNVPEIVKIIKNCVKGANGRILSTKAVIASLPESQSYLKIINIPKTRDKITGDFVEGILSQHFPLESSKSYFDWQFIDSDKIMLGVAPKNIVDSFTSVIEQADLIPLSLEIESTAISRAILLGDSSLEKKYKIIMDLGATRSSIIATYDNNPVLTLNIPLSGDGMTQEIAKSKKIPFEKAEELKLLCGFDVKRCPVEIKKIIASIINSSIKKIQTGINYINRLLRIKIDKIYICGGVASMAKLSNSLSEKLRVKIRHADPASKILIDKKLKISNEELLKYTTAIGLAIKGTERDVLAPK